MARDLSTLASLVPGQVRELHYRSHLNSPRLTGSHFMMLKRPNRQPDAGREYVPGDPVSLVDWKAFARTDQLIVREVRDEAASRVLLVADLSETMCWPTGELLARTGVTKAEVALRVALNLAAAHVRMGDLVELWFVLAADAALPRNLLKPRSPVDLTTAFERLAAAAFSPEAYATLGQPGIFEARPRDLAFWIGDGLGAGDYAAVLELGRRNFFLQVLSSLELDIGWVEGDTSYFDEGLARKEYQGQVLKHRDNYAKHLAGWRQKLESRQRRRGGEFLTVSDRTEVDQYQAALAAFARAQL